MADESSSVWDIEKLEFRIHYFTDETHRNGCPSNWFTVEYQVVHNNGSVSIPLEPDVDPDLRGLYPPSGCNRQFFTSADLAGYLREVREFFREKENLDKLPDYEIVTRDGRRIEEGISDNVRKDITDLVDC